MRAVIAPLPDLVLYGRRGCHLCEDARVTLDAILADRRARGLAAPGVVDRDIETDDDWLRRYLVTIPVLAYGERELELATSAGKIGRFLAQALDDAS